MSERLAELFRGLDRAHGVAKPTGQTSDRGKAETRYVTKREPVTAAAWEKHLAGAEGLVITPIRPDGTVYFGAIDVDVYPLDLGALARRVEQLGLPLVVCRTKSGGAHLYLFGAEPLPAELVQVKLLEWAAALGYPHVEVFPKQVALASDDDLGNGINVPYYGGAATTRYAVGDDGAPRSLDNFLAAATAARVTAATLDALRVDGPDELAEAPPCLQHWARVGVPEGQRNEVMFDFAIFCKKRWPADWEGRFEDLNRRYCAPPLPAGEVLTILKSVRRREGYTYKAKCEGPFCQPKLCRGREHGRGGGYDDNETTIDGLTVVTTVPRTWFVNVNGHRVKLTTGQLHDQRQFRHQVSEQLGPLPSFRPLKPLKPAKWGQLLEKLFAGKEVVEAPEDAGPSGQLALHLREFLDQATAPEREKLRLGHAWVDDETGRHWFRSADFADHLKKRRVSGWQITDVYNLARDLGGGDHLLKVGREPLRCWWVPHEVHPEEDPLPTPDVAPKRDEDEEIPF